MPPDFRLGLAPRTVFNRGVQHVVLAAPAKLNLFLAVTGRRSDGFHDLVSLVTPLTWGDTLTAERLPSGARLGQPCDVLTCDQPELACDESNLILQAARRFREATGWREPVRFHLEKRLPLGAGLGGGSSDAVAALQALNTLAGQPLSAARLGELAAQTGSDCALFLVGAPVVMRGRGERVQRLPEAVAGRLRGRRVLVFKPSFAISTPWAYARLAAEAPASYLAGATAEARLAAWLDDETAPVEALLFNNLERPAFAKYLALPALLGELQTRFGLTPRMSGSGSACFTFLPEGLPLPEITATIRAAWGDGAVVQDTRLA